MEPAYLCSYCPDREILTQKEAIEHEKTCVWNPKNRHCLTCCLYDNVPYIAIDENTHRAFHTSTRACTINYVPLHSNYVFNCPVHKLEGD